MISPLDTTADPFGLGLALPQELKQEELGQDEFLQLMLTQLKNQDPLKPMESGEFLGQLAQFGTVTGLGELQNSFADLSTSLVSDQALQAASLVGRSVLVQSDEAFLEAGQAVNGAVDLPISSTSVQVQITDSTGQLVRQINLGSNPEGAVRFLWGGETDAGFTAAPGRYSVSAQYFDGSEMQSAPTLVHAEVESVTVGTSGLSIQLRGLGDVPFGVVREIGSQVLRETPLGADGPDTAPDLEVLIPDELTT